MPPRISTWPLSSGVSMRSAGEVAEPSGEAVSTLLFDRLGFRGNGEDFTDPRNSYLDEVLDRRVGIPISLSLVMMEVGRRAGVAVEGIGMPGHFLVRAEGVLRDPFRGGRRLEVADCELLFHALQGRAAPFSPALLEPVGPRAILARMLANLRHSYSERRDPAALAWVVRLRIAIPGVSPSELADLARLQAEMGRFREAAQAIDDLAAIGVADPDDAARLRSRASALRARLN